MKFKAELSQEAWEELHRRLDKVRAGTSDVRVPVEALRDLLYDHAQLHRKMRIGG